MKTSNYLQFCKILPFLILILGSCKKESNIIKEKINSNIVIDKFVPEKVDIELLNNYISYQMDAEANLILIKSAKRIKTKLPKIELVTINLMISNFLVNEKNSILYKNYIKLITISDKEKGNNLFRANLNLFADVTFVPIADIPFHGRGNIPGSSTSNVLFNGTLNEKGKISGQGFSFSGTHGTIVESGSLYQSTSKGVTTYRQFFTETIILSNGVVYVQNFVVYGNIYGDTITVNAMPLP